MHSLWTRDPELAPVVVGELVRGADSPGGTRARAANRARSRRQARAAAAAAPPTNPRFTKGNFEKNLRIVDEVRSPAPSASPASKENTAADAIELTAEQIQRLNDLTPATGERHDETNMSAVDLTTLLVGAAAAQTGWELRRAHRLRYRDRPVGEVGVAEAVVHQVDIGA